LKKIDTKWKEEKNKGNKRVWWRSFILAVCSGQS